MKTKTVFKIFFFFLIFLFILFFPKKTKAEWIRYKDNPIIPKNINNNETINNPRSPAVLYENNLFKLWFMNQINNKWYMEYIYSKDGINWIKPFSNPVLSPESYENEIMHPNILKINDKYYLWYDSNTIYNRNSQIKYAWSYDGINWNKLDNPVLTIDKWWEEKGIYNPYVIYHNNKFYMWYGGWGNDGYWRIGLAFSNDGIHWEKYENNPLLIYPNIEHVGNFNLKFFDNKFHLWYLTGNTTNEEIYKLISEDGINWHCEYINQNDCLIIKKNNTEFPQEILDDSDTIIVNNKIFLYFTGYQNNEWGIGLASNQNFNIKKSISLLLPGLFASWNKKALVYNQSVNQEDWQLNPIVQEYSGIIQTFKNLGLQENQDFYLFNYDWRKSIDNISDDLNQFINKIKNNNQNVQIKFNLIGHSLGGLVARIYSQKYGVNDLDQIITVGSPHQGTAQVYKVLEAGEIETPNNIQWLIFKLILQIYKDGIKTDKQIIQEKIPVVKDLLATYPLLKDEQSNPIPIEKMTIKNNLFLNYNQTFSQIFPYLYTISGKDFETPFGYQVKPRTIFDQIMDYYPDGRPINQYNENGDGTVLLSSSQNGSNFINFNLNHGEIIYKKDPIKKILERLGLNFQESQISEGKSTQVKPSLIISLLSPATLSLTLPDNSVINDQDGLILVENPQNGNYQLKVIGNQDGQYKIIVGQITENKDYWNTIENQTKIGKEEKYSIYFNNNQPEEFFIDKDDSSKLKEIIINEIKLINNPPNDNLNAAIKKLSNFKRSDELFIVHKQLFNSLNKLEKINWSRLLAIIDKLERFYNLIAKKPKTTIGLLKIELKYYQLKSKLLEKILILKKKQGDLPAYKLNFYQLANEKLEKARKAYENKNYSLAEILLETVKELTIRI